MGADEGSRAYTFRSIGVIRSEHAEAAATPIQPAYATGSPGRAEVFDEYAEGLADLEGFSHIHLLYVFHRAKGVRLRVVPFLEEAEHGVFATRAPSRPCPIGLSLVRLVRREGSVLHLEDVDVLDGAPLLDIKPYIPRYDVRDGARVGWQEGIDEEIARRLGARGWRGR